MDCSTLLHFVGPRTCGELNQHLALCIREFFSLLDDVTNWYPMQMISDARINVGGCGSKNSDDLVPDLEVSGVHSISSAGVLFLTVASAVVAQILLLG